MRIRSLSVKGSSPWNEDFLVLNETVGLFAVIDGATSLVPYVGANGETGGALAAKAIGQYLNQGSFPADNQASGLLQLILDANKVLRDEMEQKGIMLDNKAALWSACAVAIQLHEHWIHYVHAGDCMLIAYYEDGSIRIVTHDQLEHIDQMSLDAWAAGVAAGITNRDELWAYAKQIIVNGRQLANAPGGYGVLNGDPNLQNYAEYGRISKVGVKAILLISDGLYRPKAAGEAKSDGALELAVRVQEIGVQAYLDGLIALEESDPECVKFPRVKKSDDKTAIYIEL